MTGWYEQAGKMIRMRFGEDAKPVMALLAATSPRSTMRSNVRFALKVYWAWKNGTLVSKGLPSHLPNVARALASEELRGRKVRSLFANLMGDEDVVCVDRWLVRYYRPGLNVVRGIDDKLYDEIEQIVKDEAEEAGVTAAMLQIEIWQVMRGKRESYADCLSQLSFDDGGTE